MAEADERLYLDKDFLETKIKPCRDDLTEIYINTFYDLPWQLINPCPNFFPVEDASIDNVLKSMSRQYSKSVVTALTDTLKSLGLMVINPMAGDEAYTFEGLPTTNFIILANFYRWAEPGARTYLKHLPTRFNRRQDQSYLHPKIVGRI